MRGLTCSHCGEMVELFGSGGGEKTARATGIKFLGRIPFDSKMVACGDSGTSFQAQYKDSPVTRAFAEVADNMAK
jgi:ATP-binding protein involved in chromosome partitioning